MANFRQRVYRMALKTIPGDAQFEQQITFLGTEYDTVSTPVVTRYDVNQFTSDSNIPSSGIVVANLVGALNLDYSFSSTNVNTPVRWEQGFNGDEFSCIATSFGVELEDLPVIPWLEVIEDIPEQTPSTPPTIIDIVATEASFLPEVNCRFDFTILPEDDVYPCEITSPINKTANTFFDLWFEWDRYSSPREDIVVVTNGGVTITERLPTVSYNLQIVDVDVTYSVGSGTAVINASYSKQDIDIELEYSLDNINWRSSNYFYSLLPGNYSAFVRDNLGAKKSQGFTIEVVEDKPDPFFNIPQANSLKFYEKTELSSCGIQPTYDNSSLLDQNYYGTDKTSYAQLVQKCDVSTYQIRTTYDDVNIDVKNSDGDTVLSTVSTEKIELTNLLDKRDAKILITEDNRTIVYFLSGNIYEPGTEDVIDTYTFVNGEVPEFATSFAIESGIEVTLITPPGNPIGGTYLVQDVVYVNEINGFGFEINVYVPSSLDLICESKYNSEPFDVHEFSIIWDILDEGCYYLDILASDLNPAYDDLTWISEPVLLLQNHKKQVVIDYSATSNTANIFYDTGITFKLRVPARFVKPRDGGENEGFTADTGKQKTLKNIVTREINLETSYIPQYLAEKISIASGHDILSINGESSVLVEKGEYESFLDERSRFVKYDAWYQTGTPIEVLSGSGIVSTTGRTLEVNGSALEVII